VPKLNNHIEKKVAKELEQAQNTLEPNDANKDLKEKIQKETFCSRNTPVKNVD
jgi:hypothetical protein